MRVMLSKSVSVPLPVAADVVTDGDGLIVADNVTKGLYDADGGDIERLSDKLKLLETVNVAISVAEKLFVAVGGLPDAEIVLPVWDPLTVTLCEMDLVTDRVQLWDPLTVTLCESDLVTDLVNRIVIVSVSVSVRQLRPPYWFMHRHRQFGNTPPTRRELSVVPPIAFPRQS